MLVLTRRPNQSIMVGPDVVVTVLEVRGDQVRLGIRAPRDVAVHREEVFAELARANRQAAAPDPAALDRLGAMAPPVPSAPPAPHVPPVPSAPPAPPSAGGLPAPVD